MVVELWPFSARSILSSMRAATVAVLVVSALACGSGESPSSPDGRQSPLAVSIAFVESTPSPGSTIVPVVCARSLCAPSLSMTFEVSSLRPVAFPFLQVELLDDVPCGNGLSYPGTSLQPSHPLPFSAGDFVLGGESGECAYPTRVASMTTGTARAILSSGGSVLAQSDFPVRYTFSGPPLSANPTSPNVAELCWEIPGPSGGWCGDMPLPDDRTSYRCRVVDDDGDEITVSLSFQSTAGCLTDDHCWSVSQTFEPRLVPLPVEVLVTRIYPQIGARLSCRAVDARGRASRVESVCLGGC